ncbi:MAG: hypothetical protein ACRDJ5_09595, partial [Actinomycetota bacterium]
MLRPRRSGALAMGVAVVVGTAAFISRDAGGLEVLPSTRRPISLFFTARAAPDAHAVLSRHLSSHDYVGFGVAEESAGIRALIGRRHRYVLPPHLGASRAGVPGVRHWVQRGCGKDAPGMIVYDPEHWDETPSEEQRDVAGAISKAADIVHSTGCHSFGIAPDAAFMFGFDADDCSFDLEGGILRNIDWRRIDLLDVQAQRLLSGPCLQRLGLHGYRHVVSTIAAFVRERSPRTRM